MECKQAICNRGGSGKPLLAGFPSEIQNRSMANKYRTRRRALKESQVRSENPFASPRYGGVPLPRAISYTPPPPMDRKGTTLLLCLGLTLLITALYAQTGLRGIIDPS